MEERYPRFYDKTETPTADGITAALGLEADRRWKALASYLEANYDFEPASKYYGKSYGWTVQYRKSGKTLVSLFPETGAFTVLVTIGPKELVKAGGRIDGVSRYTQDCIAGASSFSDGIWLWIRVLEDQTIEDIKHLVTIKKMPGRASRT
jgi:hypothetical protein